MLNNKSCYILFSVCYAEFLQLPMIRATYKMLDIMDSSPFDLFILAHIFLACLVKSW